MKKKNKIKIIDIVLIIIILIVIAYIIYAVIKKKGILKDKKILSISKIEKKIKSKIPKKEQIQISDTDILVPPFIAAKIKKEKFEASVYLKQIYYVYKSKDYKKTLQKIKLIEGKTTEKSDLIIIYFIKANTFFYLGDYKAAAANFEKVTLLDKKNLKALYNAALSYYYLEKYKKTLELTDNILAIDNNFYLAYNLKAFVYLKKDNFKLAKKYLLRTISIKKDFEFYYNLALICNKLSERNEMIKYLEEAVKLKKDYLSLFKLGNMYYEDDKFDKAIEKFLECLKLKDNFEVDINLGKSYFYNNDYKNAIKYLKKAVQKERNEEAAYFIGKSYEKLKDYNQAKKWYKQTTYKFRALALYYEALILENAKKSDQAVERLIKSLNYPADDNLKESILNELGTLFYRKKEYSKSSKIFEQLLKIKPNTGYIYYNYAANLYELNNYRSAAENFYKAYELSKEHKYLKPAGLSYFKFGDYKMSQKMLLEYFQKEKTDFDALTYLGYIYIKFGEYENANKFFEKAFLSAGKDAKNQVIALKNLGAIYDTLKKYELAIATYKKASNIAPKDPFIFFNLGLVYKHTDNLQAAIKQLKIAINIDDKNADFYDELAICYYESGMDDLAEYFFKKAIEVNAKDIQATYNYNILKETRKK